MSRRGCFHVSCLLVALVLAACDKLGPDTPRSGWERTMHAYATRDYGRLWDELADASRQDTVRVLTHVKRDPRYRESMRVKFHISPDRLDSMSPREFFIALMAGVERSAPQAIALRAETARDARFGREVVNGDQAVVFWDSERGGPEKMAFSLEGERWRPIIERPAAN